MTSLKPQALCVYPLDTCCTKNATQTCLVLTHFTFQSHFKFSFAVCILIGTKHFVFAQTRCPVFTHPLLAKRIQTKPIVCLPILSFLCLPKQSSVHSNSGKCMLLIHATTLIFEMYVHEYHDVEYIPLILELFY